MTGRSPAPAALALLLVLGIPAPAAVAPGDPDPDAAAPPAPALGYPLDGTRYPANLAPPRWSWRGGDGPWSVELALGEAAAFTTIHRADTPAYTPPAADWRRWRARLDGAEARLRVRDAAGRASPAVSFAFAEPAEGTLVFRLVTAPFFADRLLRTRLRRQAVSEPAPAPLPGDPPATPCRGCHAATADGHTLAVNVRDPYDPRVELIATEPPGASSLIPAIPPGGRGSALTWTADGRLIAAVGLRYDYEVRDDGFTLVHHASDLAITAPGDDGWRPIAGAADPGAVEDFPALSPDGATLAFVRGEQLDTERGQLAIWTVPFADGAGGEARPLPGGGGDDRSCYYPRWSPDGRWLAFVCADAGYFARPTAELWLAPVDGGPPRRLAIHVDGRMDSWPSWSLDGRWLAYASRRDDPDRTRIYLTRVGDDGRASPPVPLPGDVGAPLSYNHPTFTALPAAAPSY